MESPTIIYEDNAACVTQMQTGQIKSNNTKHIAPKLFYPHELQQSGEINILQTKSCDNLADFFTKSLPASTFEKCVRGIGMRRLRDLQDSEGRCPKWYALLERITLYSFPFMIFFHGVFSIKVFNEAMLTQVYVSISSFPHRGFYGNTNDIDYSIELVELME